jgi:hypothetical protein
MIGEITTYGDPCNFLFCSGRDRRHNRHSPKSATSIFKIAAAQKFSANIFQKTLGESYVFRLSKVRWQFLDQNAIVRKIPGEKKL